jgi:hypothetical protein
MARRLPPMARRPWSPSASCRRTGRPATTGSATSVAFLAEEARRGTVEVAAASAPDVLRQASTFHKETFTSVDVAHRFARIDRTFASFDQS